MADFSPISIVSVCVTVVFLLILGSRGGANLCSE